MLGGALSWVLNPWALSLVLNLELCRKRLSERENKSDGEGEREGEKVGEHGQRLNYWPDPTRPGTYHLNVC